MLRRTAYQRVLRNVRNRKYKTHVVVQHIIDNPGLSSTFQSTADAGIPHSFGFCRLHSSNEHIYARSKTVEALQNSLRTLFHSKNTHG